MFEGIIPSGGEDKPGVIFSASSTMTLSPSKWLHQARDGPQLLQRRGVPVVLKFIWNIFSFRLKITKWCTFPTSSCVCSPC